MHSKEIKRRVFDCFTFLDELEVLELRLGYLSGIVDVFVIAQAEITHRGKKWCPILHADHSLIAKFRGEVEFRFTYSDGIANSVWGREKKQRSSIDLALHDLQKNDIVFVSDLDEVPSREQVEEATALSGPLFHCVPMRNSINAINLETTGFWNHAKVISGVYFHGAQKLREEVLLPKLKCSPGHHLTVLGGEQGWKRKYEITPHLEMIMRPQDLRIFLENDLYPSYDLIKLWGGGRLRRVEIEEFDSFYQFAWESNQELFVVKKVVISNNRKKLLVASLYVQRLVFPKVPYRELTNTTLLFLSPILRLIYTMYFPRRLWSLIVRKGKLRTRIKRLRKALRVK